MAFRTSNVTVTNSVAVMALEAQAGDVSCEIRTYPGNDIFVGGPDVTSSNGLRVTDSKFATSIRPGDQIWVLGAESSSVAVRVLVRSA